MRDLPRFEDEAEIVTAMNIYAEALDARDWPALDRVFAVDIEADYGALPAIHGRAAVVSSIRTFLEPCGPTQHLLGPSRIAVDGDGAESVTPIRAFHADALDVTRSYEAIGRYHVRWTRTAKGWRAIHWRFAVVAHVGDGALLGP